jgi:hypothetical protein
MFKSFTGLGFDPSEPVYISDSEKLESDPMGSEIRARRKSLLRF